MNSSPVRGKGCNIPAAFQKEKQIISDNRIIGSPCDGVRESSSAMAQVDLVRRHSTEIGFESIDRWKCGVESLVRGRTSPDASSQKCGVQSLVQSGVTPNASLGCGGDPLVRGRTNHDASFECGGDPLVQGRTNHDASLECGVHSPVQGGATPNASLECGGGSPVPSGATAPCKESVSFKFLRSQSTGVHVSPGRGDLSKKGQFGPSLRDRHRNSDLHCRTSDDEDPVFSVQDPGCVNETLIHGDSFGRRIEDSNVDINIASQGLEPAEGFAEDESGYVSSEAHNGSVDSIIKTPSSHSKLRRKRKASYHPMPLTSSPKHSTMTSELFIIPESPLGKELATETKEKKITSKTFPQQVHASNKSAICAMKEQSSHSKPIDLTVDLRMLNKNSINSQEPMIQNEAQKPGLKGNHLESKNMEVKQEVFSNRNNFTTSLWINPSENLENIPSALKLSDAVVVSDSDDFEEVTSCLRSPRLTGWRGRNRDGGKSKNGRPPTKKNKANEYEGDGSDNSILQELNIKGTTRNKKKETNNINKILKERRPASERGHMGVTDDKVSTWPGDDLEVSFDLILEENTLEQESMRPKIRLLRRRKSRTQGTQTSPETKSAVPEFPIEERQYFSRKGLAGTDIDASTWPKKVSARSREKRTEKPIKSRKSLSFHSEETPADEQENCFIQGAPGEQEEISTDPIHWVASHPTLPLVEFSPPRRGGIQHWNYKGEDGIRPEIESFRREESKLLIRDNSDSDIQVETDDEGMADPKMADFDLVNNMSCQIVPKNDDHPTKEPVEHKGLGCDASDIGQSVCGVDRSHKTNDENSMSTFTFYGAESSRKSQKVTNTLSEIIKNLRRKSWLQTPVQKKTSNLSIGNLKTMIKEAERRKRRNCVELGSARQADDVVVEGGGSIITLSDKLIEGTQGQRICMAKRSEARLINNQENNLFNGLATLGGSTIRDGDAQAPRRTRIGKRVVRTAPTAESLANKESGWNLAHTRVTLKGGPTKGLVVNGRCTQSTVRSRVTCSNIPGTSFSVDTFSCGEILGCKAYFLSHFHSHCYRGLTSTFVNTIYCSKVTGNLLRSKLGVRDDLIHRLPLHTVCLVEAIRVVLIEANHCPGSVMFLFLLDDGKRLLYTGDFRVDQSMLKNPHLTALRVDVCYLDTMHCQPDWEFPTRAEMQQFVQGVARKALKRNPRTLLVSGYQYLGHEALFMALAEVTGTQAAMSVDIYDTMLTLGMEELRSAVTLDFHSSQLHVLPLLQLGIKGLRTHWKKFMSRYDYILAFKPSGWPSLARRQALNGLQPCVTENIILYAIPFSEHSSYSELRHFVQWLRPQHLVPMVISPTQKSRLSTETTLASWLAEANESVRSHYQH